MSQIESLTREQRRALAYASRDRLLLGARLRPVVTIGNDQYDRDDLVTCTYAGDDGAAMLADMVFKRRIPRETEQKRVRIDFEVDSPGDQAAVRVPGFAGYALRRRSKGFAITAATGSYEAGRTPVGHGPSEDLALGGARLDTALFDLLQPLRRRFAGYELGPWDHPRIYRRGPERITWNQYIGEAAGELAEAGKIVLADTPTNVAFGYTPWALDRDQPPSWHFEKGVDCEEVGDETPDGERYAKVVVCSAADDDGRVLYKAEAAVQNRGHDVFGGSVLMHTHDLETDHESAWVTAYRLARRIGRNDTEVSVEPNYPPFMFRRGDVCSATGKEFSITERGIGGAAYTGSGPTGILKLYRYLFRVAGMEVDALGMTGSVSGEGLLIGTEEKEMSLPEYDRGGAVEPLWGELPDTTSPYFFTELPWVRQLDETRAELDLDEADRHGVGNREIRPGVVELEDEE